MRFMPLFLLMFISPVQGAPSSSSFDDYCKVQSEGGSEAGRTLKLLAERLGVGGPLCSGLKEHLLLESMDLSQAGIVDITPLKFFKDLKNLSLRQNRVVTLTPIRSLSKLKELDITDNRIQDLSPLKNLTSLSILKAQRNNYTDTSVLDDIRLTAAYFTEDQICEQERRYALEQKMISETQLTGYRVSGFGPVWRDSNDRSLGIARFVFCGAVASQF